MQNYNSKFKNKKNLKNAVDFHGHLGPYLVLGILAGEYAIKELKCKKYFGLNVKVYGANKKPKSCLVDGLQLSTGATYGKGNISKFNGKAIKIFFLNCANNRKITLGFNEWLIQELNKANTHQAAEVLARNICKINSKDLFILKKWPFQD